ncbi:MAG: hypothetical protein K2X32_10455 [Phycisphaerales bacterium]|nr:hypothetical protein [Phycisphaerales bacterium]
MIPGRMVLLVHELDDGTRHFDWLIQRPQALAAAGGPIVPLNPDARELLSFRVAERMDGARASKFAATKMDNHRNLYLTYSGPISGGRGSVRQVARGTVLEVQELEGAIAIRGAFLRGERYLWAGMAQGGQSEWAFQRSRRLGGAGGGSGSADHGGSIATDMTGWGTYGAAAFLGGG